ncbi:hypothetical protein TNCV_93681 [Trichonephila clavipes]|nr:hypothetical protein TNCV_93681 [Trichonephila clavipes]
MESKDNRRSPFMIEKEESKIDAYLRGNIFVNKNIKEIAQTSDQHLQYSSALLEDGKSIISCSRNIQLQSCGSPLGVKHLFAYFVQASHPRLGQLRLLHLPLDDYLLDFRHMFECKINPLLGVAYDG